MKNEHVFYVVLVEGRTQGPIVLETEMEVAGKENAGKRMLAMSGNFGVRGAIVRCSYEGGNRALFEDMCRHAENFDQSESGF